MFRLRLHLLAFLAFAACTTQGRETPPPHASAAPAPAPAPANSRAALQRAYRQAGKVTYIYGTADRAAAADYAEVLRAIAQQSFRFPVAVRPDTAVTAAELAAGPVLLIGSPASNTHVARLLPHLPFTMAQGTITFNGKAYSLKPTISLGIYPNPDAPGMPLSVITAPDDRDVLTQLRGAIGQRMYGGGLTSWGYQVREDGQRRVVGFFDDSDPDHWRVGDRHHWDFGNAGKETLSHGALELSLHGRMDAVVDLDSVAETILAGWQRLEQQFGWPQQGGHVQVHVYGNGEHKGLETGDTRPAHADGAAIHVTAHPALMGSEQAAANLWRVRQALGAAKSEPLELGLATWATAHWQVDGWRAWAQRWAAAGEGLTIAEMLDPEVWAHESPYLKESFSAALVDYLLGAWGKADFLAYYARPEPSRLLKEEKSFARYLAALPSSPILKRHASALPAVQKAFNFAHEGYQIYNGYLSTEATRSLAYTAEQLHCNATAIIPYAGIAEIRKPSWIEFSNGPGGENDESILHCIWSAKEAGEVVMLKPQVWPWQEWTGEIAMTNEADWNAFFDHYYRWIRHYAIMAELSGSELLCMGVEFSKATLQRPENWRAMALRLKKLYHGKLTYAANWGEEFEQNKFWDALDYVAINCYYPLSKDAKASEKALKEGMADVVRKVEKVANAAGKKVLFTEIGFRSCQSPWMNPHAEADGRPADAEAQAACYKAMIEGLSGKPWLGGIYLWKWPAYMDDGRHDLQGFTPLGKPAEKLVEAWFRKL